MEVKQHYDAAKFGSPHIGEDVQGVRILDLIRSFQAPPLEIPLGPAAAKVLDKLEALGDALPLYRSGGSGWARPTPLRRMVTIQTGTRTIDPFLDATLHRRHAEAMGQGYGVWLSNARAVRPRQVPVTKQEDVSWLATLRDRLVTNGNLKGLELADLVRLGIPRQLANELFGCGPAVSWWDTQPPAFALNSPGLYPPPELQGIRAHDADKWGALLASGVPPRSVVRVADMVHFLAHRAGLYAVRDMAGHVLDAIGNGAPGLFLLRQGTTAAAVDPGHVWRRRFPSGAEHRQAWRESNERCSDYLVIVSPGPAVELDEAEARGLAIDDETRAQGWIYCQDDWPELPELTGAAGALQLARLQWVERARSFADLDAGDLGRLAVPLAWAIAKFGVKAPQDPSVRAAELTEQPPVELHQRTAPQPVAIVVELPAKRIGADRDEREQRARAEFKRAKEPGEVWTGQHLAELLRQFEWMTCSGAGKLKSDTAHAVLSDIWGMGSANTARTYLTKARAAKKETKPARRG